jgi:Zn finger protein HypA/HybF involved in hydrogenase expression
MKYHLEYEIECETGHANCSGSIGNPVDSESKLKDEKHTFKDKCPLCQGKIKKIIMYKIDLDDKGKRLKKVKV